MQNCLGGVIKNVILTGYLAYAFLWPPINSSKVDGRDLYESWLPEVYVQKVPQEIAEYFVALISSSVAEFLAFFSDRGMRHGLSAGTHTLKQIVYYYALGGLLLRVKEKLAG